MMNPYEDIPRLRDKAVFPYVENHKIESDHD